MYLVIKNIYNIILMKKKFSKKIFFLLYSSYLILNKLNILLLFYNYKYKYSLKKISPRIQTHLNTLNEKWLVSSTLLKVKLQKKPDNIGSQTLQEV